MAKVAEIKKQVATHCTLHCSKCGKEFDADHEDPNSEACVGPAGSSHDLHGNNDGDEAEE